MDSNLPPHQPKPIGSDPDGYPVTVPMPKDKKGRSWSNPPPPQNPFDVSRIPEDKYRIITRFAHGGMGEIFLAMDNNCRRQVALKVIKADVTSRIAIQRFIAEGVVTAHLEHPNIIPIHDLGMDNEYRICYTMKKIKGTNLQKILANLQNQHRETCDQYPLSRLLNIFQSVCDAIAFAHHRGIIHRDLKPENIMVGEFGEVLVLDWGIAKVMTSSPFYQDLHIFFKELDTSKDLSAQKESSDSPSPAPDQVVASPSGSNEPEGTRIIDFSEKFPHLDTYNTMAGEVFGTLGFMAPEQREGRIQDIDQRCDVFSLGVILYYLLTLRLPFSPSSPQSFYVWLKNGAVIPPSKLSEINPDEYNLGEIPIPIHCPGKRVPQSLSAVVMKAISPEVNMRYQTVAELQEDIRKYQSGFATSAEDAGIIKLLILMIKRHLILTSAILIILIMTIIFMVQLMESEKLARHHQKQAETFAETAAAESLSAQRRLAQSLIAEGNAWGALRQWEQALPNYSEAENLLALLGDSPFPAQLGRWKSYRHSPLPLVVLPNQGSAPISLAISADGTLGCSGTTAGKLIIWDLITGSKIRELAHPDLVNPAVYLAFSPAGSMVLAGHYDGKVGVWDLTADTLRYSRHLHTRWITSLAWSPTGETAASASADGRIELWNIESGTTIHELDGHPGGVESVDFSAAGDLILSGGDDAMVRVWQVNSGKLLQTMSAGKVPIVIVRFGNQDVLAYGGDSEGQITSWEVNSGNRKAEYIAANSLVINLYISTSPDVMVAAYQNGQIIIWDRMNREPLKRSYCSSLNSNKLKFSLDGRLAFTTGPDENLIVIPTGQFRELVNCAGHTGLENIAQFSRDNRLMVSGGSDKMVILWDVATGTPLKTFKGHERNVTFVGFTDDDQHIISASLDGSIRLWDMISGTNKLLSNEFGPILFGAMSPARDYFLVVYKDDLMVYWSLDQLKPAAKTPVVKQLTRKLNIAAKGDKAIAVTNDEKVCIYTLPSLEITREFSIPDVRTAELSADETILLAGSRTGSLSLWDPSNGNLLREITQSTFLEITDVAFTADGLYVFAVNRRGELSVWSVDTGKAIGVFTEHDHGITAMEVAANGKLVLTCGQDKTIKIWDFGTPEKYSRFLDRLPSMRQQNLAHPENTDSLTAIGTWYMYRGLWKPAVDLFLKAQRNGARETELQISQCYWQLGQYDPALSQLELVSPEPSVSAAYLNLYRQTLTQLRGK